MSHSFRISKQDALNWFRFFAELPEEEPMGCRQQEIALAVFAQIEAAVEARRAELLRAIPGLKAVLPGPEGVPVDAGSGRPAPCSSGRRTVSPPAAAAACWAPAFPPSAKPTAATPPAPSAMTTACWTASRPSARACGKSAAPASGRRICPCSSPCRESPPASPMSTWSPSWRSKNTTASSAASMRPASTSICTPTASTPTEENLTALGEAGLDELRFNLGATQLLPQVGIETPMTREFNRPVPEEKGPDPLHGHRLHELRRAAPEREQPRQLLGREPVLLPDGIPEPHLQPGPDPAAHENRRGGGLAHRGARLLQPHQVRPGPEPARQGRRLVRPEQLRLRVSGIPYAAFLPVLEDPDFTFLEEEPLPAGFRPGDIVL